ncbi:hypothetical protein EGH22_11580 [Halomicroarcula sp. F28]|uniref:DUF6517 family protein n=1 Tax=Haloarcula salinisoli TaxID=2487746 RepID=UPI001C7354B1|nr:DUF6517 family protein [Halomicroarcula salinisoli]MBX0286972.1 hypothetical protein [Halomicroarcula salinisoli]
MSHGVGPLFLTAPNNSPVIRPLDTTSTEDPEFNNLGLGEGKRGDDVDITIGSTTIDTQPTPNLPFISQIYWNYLDTDWAENTQTTVAVFTTPSASVGGRSLNPLSEVDENEFVTADGAEYLEESGIREAAGLGSNLSWVVAPAEVASRSVTFLGNQTPMRSYVGYVTTSDSEIPRTLLINLATTETGDDIAFGVTVQHRAMYSLSESNATPPGTALLSGMSVPDLVGDEANSIVSVGENITLITDAGVTTSADLAATALGDLSLA